VVNLTTDEDLIKNDFPSTDVPVVISRSLGEDKGMIDLLLKPGYGSMEKKYKMWREKAIEDSKSWPEYSFPVNGGTVKFKLPHEMKEQTVPQDMFAFFKNDTTNRDDLRMLMANQSVDKVTNNEELEAFMGTMIEGLPKKSSTGQQKTEYADERGTMQVSGPVVYNKRRSGYVMELLLR